MRSAAPSRARVAARDVDGGVRGVDGDDTQARPFADQRHGHAAAAGPGVDHRRGREPDAIEGEPQQGFVHQQFRFLAGNQHVAGDFEEASVELALAGDVSQGLAPGSPRDGDGQLRKKSWRRCLIPPRQPAWLVPLEVVPREQ